MRFLAVLLAMFAAAPPVLAQSGPALDGCLPIGQPFYICDAGHDWQPLDLPEDLQGVGARFTGGINAEINVAQGPYVGIQVRAAKYSSANFGPLLAQELTMVDGFPAVTYIYTERQNGQDMVVAQTELLLYRTGLSVITMQKATAYTPTLAAVHAGILAKIIHEWSLN